MNNLHSDISHISLAKLTSTVNDIFWSFAAEQTLMYGGGPLRVPMPTLTSMTDRAPNACLCVHMGTGAQGGQKHKISWSWSYK